MHVRYNNGGPIDDEILIWIAFTSNSEKFFGLYDDFVFKKETVISGIQFIVQNYSCTNPIPSLQFFRRDDSMPNGKPFLARKSSIDFFESYYGDEESRLYATITFRNVAFSEGHYWFKLMVYCEDGEMDTLLQNNNYVNAPAWGKSNIDDVIGDILGGNEEDCQFFGPIQLRKGRRGFPTPSKTVEPAQPSLEYYDLNFILFGPHSDFTESESDK